MAGMAEAYYYHVTANPVHGLIVEGIVAAVALLVIFLVHRARRRGG
jgi:hypothetical protein